MVALAGDALVPRGGPAFGRKATVSHFFASQPTDYCSREKQIGTRDDCSAASQVRASDSGRSEARNAMNLNQLAPVSDDPRMGGDMQNDTIDDAIERRLARQTPSLLPLAERLALAAANDVAVLITGETGTGKTYLARLLHDCSPRKDQPFVSVPCGAQPASLFESAFFGHVKGAFTGADRAKTGKFEAAGRGTILLDEIDTLGLEQQAALLRVIETGEYEPVGSNETKTCKARIVVASNWDLEDAVNRGRFREDLYYRINVLSFYLPPLRERVEDIAPLVRGMAAGFNTKFRKKLFDVSPPAMTALETFPWPGNIRQLENFVQQAVLVSDGPELLLEHLPQPVRDYRPACATPAGPVNPASLSHNRERLERDVIRSVLANTSYSKAAAASALGISRVTLYKKIKKYGLSPTPLPAVAIESPQTQAPAEWIG
jgi:transcriptional regulator with PAS, ATPase and Fis domain